MNEVPVPRHRLPPPPGQSQSIADFTPAPPPKPVTSPVGNIAKAIAGVMREVGSISKGGYNKFHNYKYARMEDLLHTVTPLMGKYGLAVIQNEVERNVVETRLAVTYEFSILHESGEVWPERPRFTGMSIARDSKGNWDDKAINKTHTAARKYFLLSLFQVPTGDDIDDADEGPPQQQQRIPSPPYKITMPQGTGADQWAGAYIKAIERAKTIEELTAWENANNAYLQRLSDSYPSVYEMVCSAVERRIEQLTPRAPAGMPDPKKDTQAAINWIAQQLLEAKSYQAAEAFWNQVVAPQEKSFVPVDFELLLAEWRRAEARFGVDLAEGEA